MRASPLLAPSRTRAALHPTRARGLRRLLLLSLSFACSAWVHVPLEVGGEHDNGCTYIGSCTTPEGMAYLAWNAQQEGVVTLPSGLQYRELEPAYPGGRVPRAKMVCDIHYNESLMDGFLVETTLNSSHGRAANFRADSVGKGFGEAMTLMGVGAKWELVVPAELAYGDYPMGEYIYPGAVMLYYIHMVHVLDPVPLPDDFDVEEQHLLWPGPKIDRKEHQDY